MKNILKKVGKIALMAVASLLALVIVVIGVFNVAKLAIYREYYSSKTDICKNPGLNDGFVCQGIAASEENGVILVSGYMKDHSASRIYVTDLENNSRYVILKKGNDIFTGHAGGVSTNGENIYVANGGKVYVIPLDTVLNTAAGDAVDVGEGIEVNNNASFSYCDDTYLYVGEFNDGGKYTIEGHKNETAEGTHYAICSKYSLDDITTPVAVYSIRDTVQGICFAPDGRVIMSTSYGVSDSVYYVYNLADATDSKKMVDGAPLYYIDKLVKEVKGPAMAEGLDWYDGKVITLTESASNKYIFGKLFWANEIVGLSF